MGFDVVAAGCGALTFGIQGERLFNQIFKVVIGEGLLDEVERAFFQRRHGHRHVAMTGDEDHRQLAAAREQGVEASGQPGA